MAQTFAEPQLTLSLRAYCMGIIRPESKWKERCRALLKTATPFILRGMGAPNDWETLAMCKTVKGVTPYNLFTSLYAIW